MSDDTYQKDISPVDSVRERTGIYGLGFDPAAIKGLLLPGAIVVAFGVIPALLIYFYL